MSDKTFRNPSRDHSRRSADVLETLTSISGPGESPQPTKEARTAGQRSTDAPVLRLQPVWSAWDRASRYANVLPLLAPQTTRPRWDSRAESRGATVFTLLSPKPPRHGWDEETQTNGNVLPLFRE
jgi:hypothetical protein